MDLKKLEVFLYAVGCGNLSRTAEEFSYTQSGVTQMMNSLEQEIGLPLLMRSNKGVSATQEAERLMPFIREIKNWSERLEQEAALIRGVVCGNVRIGSFSSISIHWLPLIIERFAQQYPEISVEVLEGSPRHLTSWLSEGRIDMCFSSLTDRDPNESCVLISDPMYAVLPKNHPLTRLSAVPVELLAAEPFILCKTFAGTDYDTERVLNGANREWNIRFVSNFDFAVIQMVERGLGVSILPELVLKGHDAGVETRPLSPSAERSLGISVRSRREISPAMRRFIDCTGDIMLGEDAPKLL